MQNLHQEAEVELVLVVLQGLALVDLVEDQVQVGRLVEIHIGQEEADQVVIHIGQVQTLGQVEVNQTVIHIDQVEVQVEVNQVQIHIDQAQVEVNQVSLVEINQVLERNS